MFSTEGLRLKDVVLPHHTLVALVGHHQHWHLGRGEITLQSENIEYQGRLRDGSDLTKYILAQYSKDLGLEES